MTDPLVRPFGEAALLVSPGGTDHVHALDRAIRAGPPPGVTGSVPGIEELLVEFDPLATDLAAVERSLRRLVVAARAGAGVSGRHRSVPVAYGGEHGPDLDEAARLAGLTPGEIIERHAGTELRVLICGFAPGFAYLGELPAELDVPRLATPRTRTPAGSVAIARRMSGIYPAELPGGWLVIGRTPLAMFDPRREPPAYLAPGDTVAFERIDAVEFDRAASVAADW